MLLIKKKDLISIIQNTKTFNNPKIELEQYSIDATCAVDIIYFAGFEFNDITENVIFDLGAGTGRLSIACAYFKPKSIISVDLDCNALKILRKNINSLNLQECIFPICSDITHLSISKAFLSRNLKITTIMNPPFGVQKKKADRYFLEKAFSFSDVVYSIHLSSEKVFNFLSKYIKKFDWIIDYSTPFNMILEKSFKFHEKKTKKIDVRLYRFIKK
ncbi:MAG: METTL5 family protein [Promethearchaeota archaeon]